MALSYREITSGVVSRNRVTSQVANGKLWMPSSGHASIAYLDLGTEAYTELTTSVTSRTRRLSFMDDDSDIMFLPSENSATMGKVNTSTVSFSEIAMGSTARSWGDAGILYGDGVIYLFAMNASTITQYVVGKFNTADDTFDEVIKTRPAPTGGSIAFSKPFLRPADNLIYMYVVANGTSYLCSYDPADPDDELILAAWPGTGISPQAPVQVGNTIWWWDGTNDEIIPAPGGTVYTGATLEGVRATGQAIGTTIFWPETGNNADKLSAFDTASPSVVDTSVLTANTRTRLTSQLQPTKMYLPHHGHASIGVIEGLPEPPPPPPTAGIYTDGSFHMS